MSDQALRDFLYLDGNLVRSLYALLEGGVVESLSRARESHQQASSALKGEIPFLASGEAGGEVGWQQAEAETRTLHDHMLFVVEDRLRKRGTFLDFSREQADAAGHIERLLSGDVGVGRFLLLRGRVLFKDYPFIRELVESHQSVQSAVTTLSLSAQAQAGTITKRQVRQAVQAQTAGHFDSKSISTVLQWAFGDRAVVQFRPDCAPSRAFEADLEDRWLRYSRSTLRFRYGMRFQGRWHFLCQLASVPVDDGPVPPVSGQNEFKQAVDDLLENIREWIGYTHVTAPVASVVPIALYRDLG